MSVKIIANPVAGRYRTGKLLHRLEQVLRQQKLDFELVITRHPGEATELARNAAQEGWPTVAAAGGDGTVAEVAAGLSGSTSALAVIPTGTGNDLARSIGLSLSLGQAIQTLASGHRVHADLGMDKTVGRLFIGHLAIGFPADVIDYTNRNRNGMVKGSLAIILSIIQTLKALRPHDMRIVIDGNTLDFRGIAVFIMNVKYLGGGFMMAPMADFRDEALDVVLVGELSRANLLMNLPKLRAGNHVNHPAVRFLRGSSVSVSTDTPLTKLFDGDIVGTTPIEASVASQKMWLLVSPTLNYPADTRSPFGSVRPFK